MDKTIYPLNIPEITVLRGLDFLLLELPPRYMPFMPNGIGYVNNILKKSGVKFQTIDANIIFYHRWHFERMLKNNKPVFAANGYLMKEDPWDTPNTGEWGRTEVIEYFWPQFEDIINRIAKNRPKAVGISLNGDNISLAQLFVKKLRIKYPEVIIVVGGYVCIYPEISPLIFPDFDYMLIGEAELSLTPLVMAISRGDRPKDMVGIISQLDSHDKRWEPSPLFLDLDVADFPRYEWFDTSLYRSYKGEHLVPIVGSRGCNWGRCNFCGERFPFRKRSPYKIADEIEYFIHKGFNSFHFNESDVNGDPQNLYKICSEIIRRSLKVKLMGQLRISKVNTREYFNHLAEAGFMHLRFGVDGWSEATLKLQRKGYDMQLVIENLRDCHSAGIHTTVNIVLGVPGETEGDIDETVDNLLHCRKFIGKIEGFNILNLIAGSEYYNHPEHFNIRFRGDKNEIYRKYRNFIPPEFWYSEKPYIDQETRLRRLDRIRAKLYENGIDIGPFAKKAVENLLKSDVKINIAAQPIKVTLLVLTLNEINGMKATMPRISRDWCDQVLVLDGGSTDGTIEYAREHGYEVYVQKQNGFRYAYIEALPLIKGDIVITFSPDGNSIPELIPQLINKVKEGYDMVIASRYFDGAKSEDDDLITAFGNWLFTRTINFLHGGRYTDALVIFRAYKTQIIYDLDLNKDKSYITAEKLFNTHISWEPLLSVRAAKRRLKIAEIPGDEPPRIGGKRKLKVLKWGAAYYFQFIRELFFWR